MWSDLRALIKHRRYDSALSRKLDPHWHWRALEPNLVAAAVDTLRILAWQQTKDGHKNRKRPEPIPRPGVKGFDKDPELVTASVDEVKRRLALPRRAVAA